MQLNLGCGRDIRAGWVNIDNYSAEGIDHIIDLDDEPALPFPDNLVTRIEGSHVIEHLHHPLPLMQELWRVAEPGCVAVFRTPYGSSDNADEDPTHVRRLFLQSWDYFGQPAYWKADYGYRGDWQPTRITLRINEHLNDLAAEHVMWALRYQRNVVREMVAELSAVKPARKPQRELQQLPEVVPSAPRRSHMAKSVPITEAGSTATVFTSTARTATAASAVFSAEGYRGMHLVIDCTAVTATPSVVFTIQGWSGLGDDYYTILASAAITATGTTVLRVYPGLTAAANTVANDVLPPLWRVNAAHGDSDSITYSVAALLVP